MDILISHFANKRGFNLALCNFSPKIIMISKKKRSSLRIDLLFPYFPHKIMVISKKKSSLRMELQFIYFRRQLQVFSKKKGPHSESSSNLSIFLPKFSDLPITCAININFAKSSTALLGLNFCGTKHKMPICFTTPKLF